MNFLSFLHSSHPPSVSTTHPAHIHFPHLACSYRHSSFEEKPIQRSQKHCGFKLRWRIWIKELTSMNMCPWARHWPLLQLLSSQQMKTSRNESVEHCEYEVKHCYKVMHAKSMFLGLKKRLKSRFRSNVPHSPIQTHQGPKGNVLWCNIFFK